MVNKENEAVNFSFGMILAFYVVIFLIVQQGDLADERAERVGIKASTYEQGKLVTTEKKEVVQR